MKNKLLNVGFTKRKKGLMGLCAAMALIMIAQVEANGDESQCGPSWDVQDVETYVDYTGTPRDFIDRRERAVGLQVKNGQGYCSGTLISKDLFLSAGHCNYVVGDIVKFNYQKTPSGSVRAGTNYSVTEVLEQQDAGGVDYAIVRLSGNPGNTWGFTQVSERIPLTGDRVTLIQHPGGGVKVAHAGLVVSYNPLGSNYFAHQADTIGGSSGSGVLNRDALLVGVHTNGGCGTGTTNINGNSAFRMTKLIELSPTLRALKAVNIKHKETGVCIHPYMGDANPANGTQAVYFPDCSDQPRLKFEMLENGSIRHASSGKCLQSQGGVALVGSGAKLEFGQNCGAAAAQFTYTAGGSLKHVASGLCAHPAGGAADPTGTTGIVLHAGCDEPRLAVSAPVLGTGRLSHVSGLCVHPYMGSATPTEGTDTVLHTGCDNETRLNFTHRADGRIQHSGGRCLAPVGLGTNPANDTRLVFTSNCASAAAEFEPLLNGALRHKTSGKCIHPHSGWTFPNNVTGLVLYEGCNHEKNKFFSVK